MRLGTYAGDRYIACTSISLLSEPAGEVGGRVGGLVTG